MLIATNSFGQKELLSDAHWSNFLKLTPVEQIDALQDSSRYHRNNENFEIAEKFGTYSLNIAIAEKDEKNINGCIFSLAKTMFAQKDYSKSLQYCYKLLGKDLSTDERFESHVYGLVARVFSQYGAPKIALKYQEKYYNRIRNGVGTNGYWITEERARFFLQADNIDSAKFYFKKNLSQAIALKDDYLIAHANNNIGYTLVINQEPDSAIIYLELAKKQLEINAELNQLFPSINSSLSEAYLLKSNHLRAIKIQKKTFELLSEQNAQTYQIEIGLTLLGLLLEHTNNSQEINELINTLDNLIKLNYSGLSNKTKASFINVKLNWALSTSNYRQVGFLSDSLKIINNNIFSDYNKQIEEMGKAQANLEEIAFEREKKNKDILMNQMVKDAENERLMLYLWILAILAIGVYVTLFIRKRMLVAEKQNRINKVEKELIASDLQVKNLENDKLAQNLNLQKKDLTNFSIQHSRKSTLNSELLIILNELKKESNLEESTKLKEAISLIGNEKFQDETLELVQKNIDELSAVFFNTLQTNFQLTKNDLRLCSLIKLGLSNKEIAVIRNVSPDSAKVSRHRLKKKLDLNEKTDIVIFLNNIDL